jgi:hypothetical protein
LGYPVFFMTMARCEYGTTILVEAGLAFGGAGVPPAGLRWINANKIAGETPAPPKTTTVVFVLPRRNRGTKSM